MKRKYHFIAGLPRSGSTLLSSILNQNPRFSAGITDPVFGYMRGIITNAGHDAGLRSMVDDQKKKHIMRAIMDAWYAHANPVCFNTNRYWASYTSLISDLYPESRIILCVRHVPWILDSFERLHQHTPYDLKAIYGDQDLPTVYHRTNSLIDLHAGGSGLVGLALLATKQALFSNQHKQICVIDYDHLCDQPEHTIKELYDFLDEAPHPHNFSDVAARYTEYDQALGMKHLHDVRSCVGSIKRNSVLPPDLWARWENETFWINNGAHIKQRVKWIG